MTNTQYFAELLPDASQREVDFVDTSFFKSHQHLPPPAQVRALSRNIKTSSKPKPVIFENLNVLVKFGPHVTVAEAQNLWMIKRAVHDKIPIPEVFGWRVDADGYVFIYMELIQGRTLQDRWDDLNTTDKNLLRDQLSQILTTLRGLGQDPNDQYIGMPRNYSRRTILLAFVVLISIRVSKPPAFTGLRFSITAKAWPFSEHQSF
jgi:hypothetical protein